MARRKNIQPQQHKRVITQKAEVEYHKGATIAPSALASPRCLACAAFCYPLRLNGGALSARITQSAKGELKKTSYNAGKGKKCPAYISKPKSHRKAPKKAKRAKA